MKKNHSGRLFAATSAIAVIGATLVPTAANAAEFSDIKGNSHEKAILELVKMGMVSGYPDGTIKPNKGLTNSDVVKFMGRYLIENGYKIPADYKTKMRFSDLTPKTEDTLLQFAALVKDEGIILGENGKLNPSQTMTRENMATILVNTISAIHKFDFTTYVGAQSFKEEVTDLNKASNSAQPAIRVLDFYNLTSVENFNPKAILTRGQFATFLYQSTFVKAPSLPNDQPAETPTPNSEKFNSFIVKGDPLLFVSSTYQDDADIKVFGLLGDLEVEIKNNNGNAYTISTDSKYLTVDGNRVTANFEAIEAAGILKEKTDRYDVEITVTINDTGKQIKHKITLVREDANANNSKFELIDRKSLSKKLLDDITIDVDVTTTDSVLLATDLFEELLDEGYFEIEDQYGNDASSTSTGVVTFSDGSKSNIRLTVSNIHSKYDKGVVSSNGTNSTSIKLGTKGLNEGDSFNLTLSLDKAEQTVRVYLQ